MNFIIIAIIFIVLSLIIGITIYMVMQSSSSSSSSSSSTPSLTTPISYNTYTLPFVPTTTMMPTTTPYITSAPTTMAPTTMMPINTLPLNTLINEDQSGLTLNTGKLCNSAIYTQSSYVTLYKNPTKLGCITWQVNPGLSWKMDYDVMLSDIYSLLNFGIYQPNAFNESNISGCSIMIYNNSITIMFPGETWFAHSTQYTVPMNSWFHVTVTFVNGIISVYINNIVVITYSGPIISPVFTDPSNYVSFSSEDGGGLPGSYCYIRNIKLIKN